MRHLADSFEVAGVISPLNANRWRGVSYYHEGHYRLSEMYYKKAVECKIENNEDQLSYNKCARRLSELLLVKGDYESALRVAIPAVKKMDESGIGSDIDYAILLNNIGCCQLNLGQDKEANESFLKAREHYANRWQSDSTSRGFQEAVQGTVYTSMAYINTRRYAESIYWIDRTEMLLGKYRQCPDARTDYFDEYQGRIEIMRAVAKQGLNKPDEAAQAYQAFLKTDYSRTGPGHINANDYLVAAQRYGEAAYNYRFLDQTLEHWGMEPSLDNIQLYMLPKYRANAEAGRRDSARVMGERILMLLDSAITEQKNSSTAELATIYDTQGKEAEIANQQAKLSRQRLWATGVALVLIIVFFLIYTLHRRSATQRLTAAHEKLQIAYDQLEEATALRERIESELRIARDIQMSMVPNIFPDREGLDIYASIEPAKEVGGDLYGYLLMGDELYFCLGDVSGKGVPASLFMAQATRLFRTLATQHMMPAEIATRLNSALSEDNEQGMFVTMFIGRIDLKKGCMDYCNAGHNPPFMGDLSGGSFIDMLPNAPIGLWPDLEFDGERMDDIRGRLLVVYTDGLNEAENQSQEQFGDDRLVELLQTMGDAKAQKVVETLRAAVEEHRQGAEPNDDMTIMCLRIS
ncbi:MAG: PP2C family protein-serine/threonine phosphatase [Prevotella sp.]|nr:PP2C family protein-serine/threonine phosphatase [Prevotella sp.]